MFGFTSTLATGHVLREGEVIFSFKAGCEGSQPRTRCFFQREIFRKTTKVKLFFEYLLLDGEPDLQIHRLCNFAQPFHLRASVPTDED